jgi:hypothetical protein
VLNVDHLIVRFIEGLDDLVQLQVNRLGIAVLGVLDQEDNKKRYDCRSRVDDQLPSIRVMKIGTRDQPDQDREQSDKERPFRTDPVGSLCCKNMESFFFATVMVSHVATIEFCLKKCYWRSCISQSTNESAVVVINVPGGGGHVATFTEAYVKAGFGIRKPGVRRVGPGGLPRNG